MSLFPFIDGVVDETVTVVEELPIPKEYGWNFEADEFLLVNGKMVIVEGNEAIKVWAYRALKTDRYRFMAFSWGYGNELESLIGSGFSKDAIMSEARRYIEEALSINPYIVRVDNLDVFFDGDELTVKFRLVTIYGEVDVNV